MVLMKSAFNIALLAVGGGESSKIKPALIILGSQDTSYGLKRDTKKPLYRPLLKPFSLIVSILKYGDIYDLHKCFSR